MLATPASQGEQTPDVSKRRETKDSISTPLTKAEQSPPGIDGQHGNSKVGSSLQQNAISSGSTATRLVRYRITDDLVQDDETSEKITIAESMIVYAGKLFEITQLPHCLSTTYH